MICLDTDMRSDLNKQLCERERRGSRDSYRLVRRSKEFNTYDEDGGGQPQREGMKRRFVYHWGRGKEFNENLNPLYNQIRKYLGRSWNDFYSDLCQNFDKRSVINQHILQHVYDRIAVKVFEKDGELWVHPNYGGPELLKNDGRTEYYVDPHNGIIRKNPWYRSYKKREKERALKAAAEEATKTRKIDENHVLHLVEGVWYIYTIEDLPPIRTVYDDPCTGPFTVGKYPDHVHKAWKDLTEEEKRQFGKKRQVAHSRRDALTGEYKSRLAQVVIYAGRKVAYKQDTRYHATRRTASHKQLKKAGIVKN